MGPGVHLADGSDKCFYSDSEINALPTFLSAADNTGAPGKGLHNLWKHEVYINVHLKGIVNMYIM